MLESSSVRVRQYWGHSVLQTPALVLVHSLPANGDFCYLLITFANSLDPDQAQQTVCGAGGGGGRGGITCGVIVLWMFQQNVGSDLDSNCLTLGEGWGCSIISVCEPVFQNLPHSYT